MIKAFVVVNNTGAPRLTKFYERVPFDKQQALIRAVFEVLHTRPDGQCNFVEDAEVFGPGVKLIYRHFATLYFAAVVDECESELGILDLIHVFVETLDSCFENVCELDLVFHAAKAYAVLDEMIMAGAVIETNSAEVIRRIEEVARAEKHGVGANAAAGAGGMAARAR